MARVCCFVCRARKLGDLLDCSVIRFFMLVKMANEYLDMVSNIIFGYLMGFWQFSDLTVNASHESVKPWHLSFK